MLIPDTERVIEIHKKVMENTEEKEEKRKSLLKGKEGYNLLYSAVKSAF